MPMADDKVIVNIPAGLVAYQRIPHSLVIVSSRLRMTLAVAV